MWEPISTVPAELKDGNREIVALSPEWEDGRRPILLRWTRCYGRYEWRDWDGDSHNPTHWHRLADLPDPPA